jgi:DNA polymerase-1
VGSYQLVPGVTDLLTVASAVEESAVVGLDLETTGLDPRRDKIRLLSLATDRGTFLVDGFATDPRPLFEALAARPLAIHNAAFDLRFLGHLGFVPGPVHDSLLMARLLTAGALEDCSLKECVRREFGLDVDKSHQRGDWSGRLSPEMLAYAARDAELHRRLYHALLPKIKKAGLDRVLQIEERALPSFLWLWSAGAPIDPEAWRALAAEAEREAESLAQRLDEGAPPRSGYLSKQGAWDWNSPEQVKEVFRLLGVELEDTRDETLARVDHPLADLVRLHRGATKRAGTYGADWLQHVAGDGRIYPEWKQLGSVAGRTSCAEPNLQQVPRDPRYRACFRAPEGRALIKADYSQLQLRIAAKIADDERMLRAYGAGEDLHTLTARQLTGKQEVTKNDRQLAKAVNFGLLFGLGAKGLRAYAKTEYRLDLTEGQAAEYRRAFFAAYPGLARWHRRAGASSVKECRTLAGRRRLLGEKTPYTHRLNSPVQGTEADGAKLAMALLWERRGQCPTARPVLFAHDEIVVECDRAQADAATAWLKQAMLDGMAPLIAPVPVEVEVKVAHTWGG